MDPWYVYYHWHPQLYLNSTSYAPLGPLFYLYFQIFLQNTNCWYCNVNTCYHFVFFYTMIKMNHSPLPQPIHTPSTPQPPWKEPDTTAVFSRTINPYFTPIQSTNTSHLFTNTIHVNVSKIQKFQKKKTT